MTAGTPSPLVNLFEKEDFEDWSKPHLVGATTEYSSLLALQAKKEGGERKYGNGIIVSVVTCTEIKQGVAIETGKTSQGYFDACTVIELDDEDFKALGCRTLVTTVDGSYGIKGFVTDALKDMEYTHFFTCGPEPMLKAVYKASATSGQMSFEKRMGCGFGACMGCSCKTKYGNKRICKDGPVLVKEEIVW